MVRIYEGGKEMTKRDLILGTLIMPFLAAFVLSGMAVADGEVNTLTVTVLAVSIIGCIVLAILMNRRER